MNENDQTDSTEDDAADFSLIEFFRFALSYPEAAQFEAFAKPSFLEGLRELWGELMAPGGSAEVSPFTPDPWPSVEMPAALEDLQADYIALFDAGVPGPPVPLIESHYLKNTPPSSVLIENKLFYSHFGFDHQKGREAPDHLLVQLEFVSALDYLAGQSERDETREAAERARSEFIERHMRNWLPQAAALIVKTRPTVYSPLLRLLDAFLQV